MALETTAGAGVPGPGGGGVGPTPGEDASVPPNNATVGACLLDEFDLLHGEAARLMLSQKRKSQPQPPRPMPSDYASLAQAVGVAKPGTLEFYDEIADQYVDLIHMLPVTERPTALCLSGGGIRSATFSLGVLQGLAIRQALGRFTYLSSVSGGGYIAAWLTNRVRLHAKAGQWATLECVEKDLQESAATRRPGQPAALPMVINPAGNPVARLRAYSHYLSPVMGLSGDMLALVATFLRNLVLNLCVWLALLVGVALVPRLAVALMKRADASLDGSWWWPRILVGAACACLIWALAYVVSDMGDRGTPCPPAPGPRDRFFRYSFGPGCVGALLLVYASLCSDGDWIEQIGYCMGASAACSLAGALLGVASRGRRGNSPFRNGRGCLGCALLMMLLTAPLGGALVAVVMKAGRHLAGHEEAAALAYITFAFPLVLTCFWVQMTLCAAALRPWSDEDDREWWARSSGVWLMAAIGWVAWFGLVLFAAPWVLSMLSATLSPGVQLTGGSALLGIVTSALGYWSKNGDRLKQRAEDFASRLGDKALEAMAGVVLLAVALMVTIFAAWFAQQSFERLPWGLGDWLTFLPEAERAHAVFLRHEAAQVAAAVATGAAQESVASGEQQAYLFVLFNASAAATAAWTALFGLLAIVLSTCMGANTFSLHGMYGNRLVRAYLGAARGQRDPHWFTGFDADDNAPLKNCPPAYSATRRPCLFPVVNLTLNLVQARNRTLAWQQRKGAPFTATPRRCGSVRTGYVTTSGYGGKTDGMTLGRAMTISGAAASPNMGYHSSTLVTMVMTLFNVRLGWWLANPGVAHETIWKRSEPVMGLQALLSEAFGRTTDDRSAIYLSDGGHFDNLGLYEMVRRRCHRILVVDAGADPKYEYSDLFSTVRKIRVDLGIRIGVPQKLPGQADFQGCGRMVTARIHYSDRDGGEPDDVDGVLFVLKPLLNGCEPPDLREYAATTSKSKGVFPQQSTADQFFDETQFESYRALGLHTLLESWRKPGWPRVPDPFDPEGDCNCAPGGAGSGAAAAKGTGASGTSRGESGGSGSSATGSLAGLVQHVGPGVALAAAVTVGGTIGAVGTSRFGPPETHPTSIEQPTILPAAPPASSSASSPEPPVIVIKDPGPPGPTPAPSAPPPPVPASAPAPAPVAPPPNGAASSAEAAADSARAARISADAATSAVRAMTAEASQVKIQIGAATSAVESLRGALGPPDRPASDPAALLGELHKLNESVDLLSTRVRALQPRRVSPSQ